jgi:hypothetical protein
MYVAVPICLNLCMLLYGTMVLPPIPSIHHPLCLAADFKSPAELVDMDVLAEAFQQSEGAAAKIDGSSAEGTAERDQLTGGRNGHRVLRGWGGQAHPHLQLARLGCRAGQGRAGKRRAPLCRSQPIQL